MKNFVLSPALALVLSLPVLAQAAELTKAVDEVASRGLDYLRDKGQNKDGTLSPRIGSGVTSLAVTAALHLRGGGSHAHRAAVELGAPTTGARPAR